MTPERVLTLAYGTWKLELGKESAHYKLSAFDPTGLSGAPLEKGVDPIVSGILERSGLGEELNT